MFGATNSSIYVSVNFIDSGASYEKLIDSSPLLYRVVHVSWDQFARLFGQAKGCISGWHSQVVKQGNKQN